MLTEITLYTVCLHGMVVPEDIELIDITVKSGEPAFAPTWDMVTGVKSGSLPEAAYTERYHALMRESLTSHPDVWQALLTKPRIALGCYCTPGVFCHRHILIGLMQDWLYDQGVEEVHLGGELDPNHTRHRL